MDPKSLVVRRLDIFNQRGFGRGGPRYALLEQDAVRPTCHRSIPDRDIVDLVGVLRRDFHPVQR